MLGETTPCRCGKENISLDLEEGNLEKESNRTVARSSLLEEANSQKGEEELQQMRENSKITE